MNSFQTQAGRSYSLTKLMSQTGIDQLVTSNTSDHVLSPILIFKLCEDRLKIKTVGMSRGRFNNKKKYMRYNMGEAPNYRTTTEDDTWGLTYTDQHRTRQKTSNPEVSWILWSRPTGFQLMTTCNPAMKLHNNSYRLLHHCQWEREIGSTTSIYELPAYRRKERSTRPWNTILIAS